ncbi:hypothetical protein [Nocardia sp. alder85J]|uniref:hypothetical protein n=1 Tax=Nocardia sp. alder85J TaxID=2862949 RepID=UPI001CD594DF|nr:hypothetical protein [Nocardia sp. alder85J]MCX4099142.1 hypothetical protein [Nocardia sp. alder85J]
MDDTDQLHVTVQFPALPPLHFRAEPGAARAFLAGMAKWHRRTLVQLDYAVRAGMPLLPCHTLFETPMTIPTPPLPRHTLGTTPITAALVPVTHASDPDLIERVRAGLAAWTDSTGHQNPCPDSRLKEKHPVQTQALLEEVSRFLAPADPDRVDADAWIIVTASRPQGSTEPVWRPIAAIGPMTLDAAAEYLTALGLEPVEVRHDLPIPDADPHADGIGTGTAVLPQVTP